MALNVRYLRQTLIGVRNLYVSDLGVPGMSPGWG